MAQVTEFAITDAEILSGILQGLKSKNEIFRYIIQSFSALFDQIAEKEKIISFVEKQLNSSSPKTRKAAKAFLNKFEKSNSKNKGAPKE